MKKDIIIHSRVQEFGNFIFFYISIILKLSTVNWWGGAQCVCMYIYTYLCI